MESPSSIPSYSPPSSTERKISPLPTFVLLSPSDLQSTEPSSQAVVSSSQTSNSPWTSPFPSPVPSPSSSPLNSPRDRSPISFVFPTSPLSQVGSDFPAYSAPASAFEQLPAKLKEQRFSSLDSILLSPKDIQLEPSNDTLREKQTYSSDALNYDSNIFHEREDLEHRTSFLELELKRALKVQADQMEEIDTLQHDKKNLVGQITQLKQETVLAISERDHFEHKMHGMESRMLKLQYEIDELKQEREKRVTSHSLIQRLRKGDNSWISECKTFAQKRELLEEALTSLDPEVILTVLLYLKESLSEKLFFQLLKRNSFLLDQYISFLRREGRFSSLAIIYDQLNQHWERDRCMLEKIFHCTSLYQQEEEIQKCMKHFTAQTNSSQFYQNLLELHIRVIQQIKEMEIQNQREKETREAKELFELKLPAILDSFSNMDISFWQNWTSQLNSLEQIEWIKQKLN